MRQSILLGMLALLVVSLLATDADAQPRLTTIFNATDGYPGGLSQGNGVLYFTGAAPSGVGDCAAVFELQPPGTVGGEWTQQLLYAFSGAGGDACDPGYAPTAAPDGSLYGLAGYGGAYGSGALYQLLPPTAPGGYWTERVLCSIPSSLTHLPTSGLVRGPGGSFYFVGTGGSGAGQLLQFIPPAGSGEPWNVELLYTFGQTEYGPEYPDGLIAGPDGSLYGISGGGGDAGHQFGTVFQLTPPATPGGAWTVQVLHSFAGGDAEGSNPNALVLASDGTLFGATAGGEGALGLGGTVAFQLSPPAAGQSEWTYTVLRNFGGLRPDTTMLVNDGNVFVGTQSPTGGEIFEFQPPASPGGAWTTKMLYQFTNDQSPVSQLVMTPNGILYGVTGDLIVPGYQATGTIYMLRTE